MEDAPARPKRIWWTPFDFALVAVLVAFSAFRYQVGTDYTMYFRFYQLADPSMDWWSQVDYFQQEALYTGLSLWLKTFTADPFAIFWVTSALTIIPIYAAIRKQSLDLPFAVLLYVLLAFYVAPFNLVRQGIAIAFVFWAYSFLARKNWVAFAALGAVGVAFHTSALIAVAVILIARLWKPTVRSTIVVLVVAGLGAAALWTVPAVAEAVGSLSERYETYVLTSQAAGFGTYLLVAAYLALLILMLAFRRYSDRPDWLAMLAVAVVFLILGTQSVVPARMFYYFGLFVVLLVPNTLANRPKSTTFKVAIIAGAAVYFAFYVTNYSSLVPYQVHP